MYLDDSVSEPQRAASSTVNHLWMCLEVRANVQSRLDPFREKQNHVFDSAVCFDFCFDALRSGKPLVSNGMLITGSRFPSELAA